MPLDILKPYEHPATWTPDHVMLRMIWAFDTLRRMRIRTGPGGYGSGWPGYVHEYADLVAQEQSLEAERKRRKYQDRDPILPPSQHDVSLMEEAFGWPLKHLDWTPVAWLDDPVHLLRWSYRRSQGRNDGSRGAAELVLGEAERIARALHRAGVPVR